MVPGCTGAISDDLDTLVVSRLPEAFGGAIGPGEASRFNVAPKVSRGAAKKGQQKAKSLNLVKTEWREDSSERGGNWGEEGMQYPRVVEHGV